MTAKIQRQGRAAAIRALLLERPVGATVEKILATGIDCTLKQLNNSLGVMFDAGQVRASNAAGNRVWFLTCAMRKLMRGVDDQVAAPVATAVRPKRSAPTGSNNSTTVLHKDKERHELNELLASFCRGGGKIELLGNSEVRRSLSRRQINDAGAVARKQRTNCETALAARQSLADVTPPRDLRTLLPEDADRG